MVTSLRAPAVPIPRRLPFESELLLECLTFRVGDGTFALPLQAVREILVPPSITFVPRAANVILGVISVRGQLVTVLDVRQKLRVRSVATAMRSRILLVNHPATGESLGIRVDDVMQVHRFAEADMETTLGLLGGNVSEWIVGLTRRDDQLIVLLALEPLLKIDP